MIEMIDRRVGLSPSCGVLREGYGDEFFSVMMKNLVAWLRKIIPLPTPPVPALW